MIDFNKVDSVLDVQNIRKALQRMEDTLVFDFIERAQFGLQPELYQPGQFEPLEDSFLNWTLRGTEALHSQIRRFNAPDETPFFPNDLKPIVLPPLELPEVLAKYHRENTVNDLLKKLYIEKIVPVIATSDGSDPNNSGSCVLQDIECLQALSRRIHFGKFVAEAKFRAETERFTRLIEAGDAEGIGNAITNSAVEEQVLERIRNKAATFSKDPMMRYSDGAESPHKVDCNAIAEIYREIVIPLTKKVEVDYLLRRLEPGQAPESSQI